MIESILEISIGGTNFKATSNQTKAPGLLESHYVPRVKVILSGTPSNGDGFIALDTHPTPDGVIRIASPKTDSEFAHVLYEGFRLADMKGLSRLFVVPPTGDGIAVAINDRLSKSAFVK